MTSITSSTAIEYGGHTYDLSSVVQPRKGDTVEMLIGPTDHRAATTRGVVWTPDGDALYLGKWMLRWPHGTWRGEGLIRIVKRATLPDGIYRSPDSSPLWFVKDGKCDYAFNSSGELYCPQPVTDRQRDKWTRVGDFPVIEVAE